MQDVPWLLLVSILVAWLLTDRLMPWVSRLAERHRCYDHPGDRKVHQTPIPRLGGMAIALGFAGALAAAEGLSPGAIAPWGSPQAGLLAGALLMWGLGLVDDVRPLPAVLKLGVQAIAAGVAIAGGLHLGAGSGAWALAPAIALPLTLLWLVGVTNTINLVDGLDGLAGSLSLVAAALLAALAWHGQQGAIALMACALIGALAGFLRHNWHPARIFMGDSGSLFLGFTLAALSVMWVSEAPRPLAYAAPLLIFGLPLADTAMAIGRRVLRRRSIFAPDREHLHHWLLRLCGCQRRAVMTLTALALFTGSGALWLMDAPGGHRAAATDRPDLN